MAFLPIVLINKNAKAFSNDDNSSYVTVDELWDSANKKFNFSNFNTFMKYISNDGSFGGISTSATAADIRGYRYNGKSKDKSVVITLGDLTWQVVYLTTDTNGNKVATLWLSNITQDAFKGRSSTEGAYYGYINGALYSDYSSNWRDSGTNSWDYPSNMYSTSYIRVVTLNNGGSYLIKSSNGSGNDSSTLNWYNQTTTSIFAPFTVTSNGLTDYIVQPKYIGYQNETEATTNPLQNGTNNSIGYFLNNESTNRGGDYNDLNYYNTTITYAKYGEWGNDYLWLPSMSEMGASGTAGIWAVNETERKNYDGSTAGNIGNVGTINSSAYTYTWSRSASISVSRNVYTVLSSGSESSQDIVSSSDAVRPALHLNLTAISSALGYSISAAFSNLDENRVTLDKTSDIYFPGSGTQHTFIYSGLNGHCINSVTINGTSVTIKDVASSFSSLTMCKYKCYRVRNKVVVTVTLVTENLEILATYDRPTINVYSFDPTLVLQTDSMYNIVNDDEYRTKIVATFEQSDRFKICIDGEWAILNGKTGNGTLVVDGNAVSYSHYVYNNFINIEISKLTVDYHTIYIDYAISGIGGNINTSLQGASSSTTIGQMVGDNGETIIVVNPATNEYVYEMTINGVAVPIEYYKAEVYGAGGAITLNYIATDESCTSRQFVLTASNIFGDLNIVFKLQNTPPVLKNPPSGSGTTLVGTTVMASVGGEARIVGNNIENGTDSDTVTFVAVAYSGYKFLNWVNANDESEILGTTISIDLTKSQVNGKIIKAVFVPTINNKNLNDNLNNSNEII